MGVAFDITKSDSTVEHGLGTRDIMVQAWQNNYLITPDVALKGDNELRVFAAGASETNPIRLLVSAIGTGYTDEESSEEESSGSTKSTKSKTSRSTRSKTS